MVKRILALCLSVMLSASALCACSKKEDSSKEASSSNSSQSSEQSSTEAKEAPVPSLTIDGKKQDTQNLVMMTVQGNDIGFDEFRYNYYYFMSEYGSGYHVTEEDIAGLSDEEKSENFAAFKNGLVQFMKGTYAYIQYAKDNNIELTEDEVKECEEEISGLKKEQGDGFEDYLKNGYLTEEYLLKLIKQSKIADKVRKTFDVSDDEFFDLIKQSEIKDKIRETFKLYDDFFRPCRSDIYQVRTILIPYGYDLTPSDDYLSQMGISDFSSLSNDKKMSPLIYAYTALSDDDKTAQKKKAAAHAEDITDKANSGEDFETLLSKYGFDGGMTTYSKGYVIGDFYSLYGEDFVKTLTDLEVGEVSDPFEFVYGYQILKRVAIDMDYIKENLKSDTDDTTSFKEEYQSEKEYKTLQDFMEKLKVEEKDVLKNLEYGDLT